MRTLQKSQLFSLLLAGICLWGALLYSNTLRAPFVFDDEEYIVRNPTIRNITDGRIWQTEKYRKRFVAFASFALNYRAGGLDVTGYHLVNISIHLLNFFLVVWLFLLLLQTPAVRGSPLFEYRRWIALLGGALFLCHPVQTQAVTYVSQRFESLATLFYLVALNCYLHARTLKGTSGRRSVFFILSAFSLFLGFFTKETIFTLPLVIVFAEWLLLKPVIERKRLFFYVCATMLGVFAGVHFLFPGLWANFSRYTSEGMSSFDYLAVQFRVISHYLLLWVSPVSQNLDYDFPLSASRSATFAGLVVLFSLVTLGVRWRRNYPAVSFGLFWFFAALIPTSSIFPMLDPMVEHRLYLAGAGLAIALTCGLFGILRPRWAVAGLCVFIMTLSFLTYQRNAVWADDLKLWQDIASKSPKSRVFANLAKTYQQRRAYDEAILFYRKAIDISPNPTIASQLYVTLGALYAELGDYPKQADYSLKALELNPKDAQAYSNMGIAYSMMGKHAEALEFSKKAVQASPELDAVWNNLGIVYAQMNQYENAANSFDKALQINPYHEKARENKYAALSLLRQNA